jgi:hypothetical protein
MDVSVSLSKADSRDEGRWAVPRLPRRFGRLDILGDSLDGESP